MWHITRYYFVQIGLKQTRRTQLRAMELNRYDYNAAIKEPHFMDSYFKNKCTLRLNHAEDRNIYL